MSLTNSQFDSIKRIYDDRQLAHRHEEQRRLAYVYEHVDGFRELNESISSLCLKQADLLLNGQASALSDLKDAISLLKEQKKEMLLHAGLDENYLTVPYICNNCQDTGFVNGQKCHCFKQASLSLLYDQSNLKNYLEETDFSKVSDEYYTGQDLAHFRDSFEKAMNFVNNFNNDYQNLCFYGTVGVGKSFLSGCIAKELMNKGHSVIYFSASGLIDLFSRYTFDIKGRSETEEAYHDIYNCDLLIIDDLGTEVINSFSVSRLFTCLNERALRQKSIIISTNLSLEELREFYSDRIFSRLSDHFIFCRMTGTDIRTIK